MLSLKAETAREMKDQDKTQSHAYIYTYIYISYSKSDELKQGEEKHILPRMRESRN